MSDDIISYSSDKKGIVTSNTTSDDLFTDCIVKAHKL